MLDPILKYAGSKRWLVSRLRELYVPHRHRRLVEPFVGGMSVALGLSPERALLADINPHLVNFYECVRYGLKCSLPMRSEESYYYGARAVFNENVRAGNVSGPEQAELFYFLLKTCFNGLMRFSRKGEFNVPFGKYKSVNYLRSFSPWAEAMRNWTLVRCDFENIFLRGEEFVYADPPYDGGFTDYSTGGFTWDDQVRLVSWLERHGGPVVASNLATDRILELYRSRGFDVVLVDAPRSISSDGNRESVSEMIATKNIDAISFRGVDIAW